MNLSVVGAERVLEAGLLLSAPIPFWQLLCLSPIRKGFLGKTIALAAVLGLYSGLIIAIALLTPWVLRPLAILAGIGIIFVWWRSRPNYGRRRRRPPGRLKLVPLGPCNDPRYYLTEAKRYGPVFKTGGTHPYPTLRPVVCIVGHKLGLEVLRRHDDSLKLRPELPFSRFISRGFLRHMETTDHGEYSKLFHSAMRLAIPPNSTEFIASAVRETLLDLTEDCARPEINGIRPDRRLNEMLFVILSGIFFGIEPGTDDLSQLRTLHSALNYPRITRRTRPKRIEASLAALMGFLVERARHIGECEAGDSVAPTCVLSAISRIDRAKVDDPTVIGNLAYMLEISRNDLTGLLMWLLKMLKDNQIWLDKLRYEPSTAPTIDSLASRIIRETLRLEQSEYLYRHTTRKIEVGDYIIPKGWVVRICIREAHRDPAVFPNPERFDPSRFEGKDYPLTSYAPFGLFRHMCIGAELTQAIGSIFVHELAQGFNLRAVDDGPAELTKFHWEPNARFRIKLERRT